MLVIPAYAKLNLALEVVARRADGWHDIDTLIVRLDWHDLVGVEARAAAERLDADDDLAAKAAALLSDAVGAQPTSLRVWLVKRIPLAAGLGGGSADAAATLRAGARLLARRGVDVDGMVLIDAARQLGSDVPAVLETHPVRATGTGDHVSPATVGTLWCAVAFIAPSMTRDVYAAVRPDECRAGGRVTRLTEALAARNVPDPALLGSALEPAACRINPQLARDAARLRSTVPDVVWHMTGSGGAYFGIAHDAAHAATLAGAARDAGFHARACRTVGTSG